MLYPYQYILFKRRLRKRTHFLLISLAVADLLVGLIPVPLFIMNQANVLLHTAYWVYLCVDMITGLSSIGLHPDGYFPGKTPRHCSPSSPSTTHLTQLCDCHSNPMDLLPYCDFSSLFPVITSIQASSVIIISLSTPLLITCISYCIIWRKQSSRIPNDTQARKNVHLNRTLLLITAIFVLSWLPFQVLAAVLNFCISCRRLNKTLIILVYVIKLLHYSNSFMNFLVYCFRMSDYRKALSRMFPKCRCSR